MMTRRRILGWLGIGGATVAVAPLVANTIEVGSAQEAYNHIAMRMHNHVETHRMMNYYVWAQSEFAALRSPRVGWVRVNGKTIGERSI